MQHPLPKDGPSHGYAVSDIGKAPIFYHVVPCTARPSEVPVVLCDGIGCDGFIWKYLLPQLAKTRPVIRWHYRGHGRSPNPKDLSQLGMDVLSHDLATVLNNIGIEEAHIAGHSMGVQVALEFYRAYPERTRSLVLMCGAPSEPLKTFKGTPLLETLLPAVQRTVGRAPGLFQGIGRALLPNDWIYKLLTKFEVQEHLVSLNDFMPYLKGLAQIDPTVFLAMLKGAAEHSARDLLPKIQVPALVVAGENDTFTPPDLSREMAQEIPGAELLIVHNGSHTAPLEHPVIVGQVTTDFLALCV